MYISINGKAANITLDTEKTLGDVLSGIESWVSPSGNRIQGISIDGKAVEGDSLAEIFRKDIKEVKKLDITVYSRKELAAEALGDLYRACAAFGNAAFDERGQIAAAWKESAAARFLASDISDVYGLANRMFSGEGLSASDLSNIVEERLREFVDPRRELAGSETLVKSIVQRMEELPLDIQTGKDQRAAETVQYFSGMGEKLFRIFSVLKSEGLSVDTFVIDDRPARVFIEEFNSALKELSAAYGNRDTVLAGDITEYELAPRLLKFFTALKGVNGLQK